LHKTSIRIALLLALIPASSVFAAESIWYKQNDPLNTEIELPPAVGASTDNYSACTASDYQDLLTLSDVAEAALCNNPQTREAYANAKVQAAQLGVAKSAYLPTLTDNVGANQNYSNPASVTRGSSYNTLSNSIVASYLLYDFGNRDATLENARQLLQAASATQNSTVQAVLLAAVKAYYQTQSAIAALSATLEAERAAEESFKSADAKYKAGVSTPADKLQAQTAFAQATLTRITAEGTLRTAYGTLANVMGLNANRVVRLVPSNNQLATQDIGQDIDSLITLAQQRRPDLLASEAQVRAAQASIDASKAAAKPTVSLSTSNNYQDGTNFTSNNTSSLGVTVSIPLFGGYSPTYKIRSAEAAAEVKAAQRDSLRLQISLDVWTAYQSLRTANESIKSAEALVASAKESSRVAIGRYKAGVGNIIDTLNAQSSLASANQQKIQAMLNWDIARASLAQSIGALDNAMIQSLPEASSQVDSQSVDSSKVQP